MDLETTEWGFVPSNDAVSEALDALWMPRVEWEPDWEAAALDAAEGDDGIDHVC